MEHQAFQDDVFLSLVRQLLQAHFCRKSQALGTSDFCFRTTSYNLYWLETGSSMSPVLQLAAIRQRWSEMGERENCFHGTSSDVNHSLGPLSSLD
jgi:hypothetical protein